MAAGLYAPGGVEMAYERTGPVTREYLCEVLRLALRARYQTVNLRLYIIATWPAAGAMHYFSAVKWTYRRTDLQA